MMRTGRAKEQQERGDVSRHLRSSVIALVAFVLSGFAFPALAQNLTNVVVNGQALSQKDVFALSQAYGQISPGRYWYDPFSGHYGLEGGPMAGQIDPDLPLGGPLRADASGGATPVFINGRSIHPSELVYLTNLYGSVPPGRYWLNAAGIGGPEGGPATFNLAQDSAQAQGGGGGGGGGSTVSSSDGQSSLSTGSDGCMYFSSGEISGSTC